MSNPHQDLNRRIKAEKLAEALHGAGITAEMMGPATDEQWDQAALVAFVNPPSRETRAIVLEMLAARETATNCTSPTRN